MTDSSQQVERIARVVHEALRAWAAAHGQESYPHWRQAKAWMKQSTRESVAFVLDHPDAGPGAQHDQWMAQKRRDGWRYGEVKDTGAKTHPMMVPFDDLPAMERAKDALLIAIVQALSER